MSFDYWSTRRMQYFLSKLKDIFDTKVDKVSGKGLSTNDYTTNEKNKLSGIATGAEVNVQSDWNQATTTADDYIKNKPGVVSTSANGLAPKITDTSKFLKGDGTWATPTDTNNRRSFYGTCSTGASTAAKVVTLSDTSGWELKAGTIVGVTFTNDNTASNVTLNVNGSGAKSIWYDSAAFTGNTTWITGRADRTIFYMYDGTYWRWLNFNWHSDGNDKVTQTATSTNADYEVLFSGTADNTTRTEGARKYSNLKFNPSTGNLQATQLNGVTIGNSPKFTDNNTTYSFAQGDNAGTIKVTPSGGSASNIPVKPFDLSIAADSGTSALTMAASTKYKLTAGGSSFIFTSTPNTWRGIQNNLTSDDTDKSLSAAQGKALANGSARDSTKLPLAGGTMTGKITSAKANNFYATGSGTAAQDKGEGVSPRYFPAKWTFNTGANASNGDTIIIKVPVAGHSYGVFVSINNGTNYYPVAVNYSTGRLQTHYPNGAIIQLVFDSSGTVNDVFALNGGDARTNVSGGCWRVLNWYDTNTDIRAQSYCDTAAATAAKVASCTNYNLLSKSYILVTMVYANSSASALTLNVNGKGAKPIYINGSASSASNYTLPAGTYLVYYNGTNYYFRTDGKITASITGDAATVNGKTVGVNVPSDAVFTDTKVTQTATSTNANYEVLFSATADNTTRTEGARKYSNLKFNPSTGNLQATQLNGATIGNSPKFTDTIGRIMYLAEASTTLVDGFSSQILKYGDSSTDYDKISTRSVKKTVTLSTTTDTTVTFKNAAINASSIVDVYSSIYGVNPKSVACTYDSNTGIGTCTIVFGPYTSAASLDCEIYLRHQ